MNDQTKLIATLASGEAAVIPTDTLYGIVAVASNPQAVERVYELRRRSPAKPCIILTSDIEQLEDLGIILTPTQTEFVECYWPGPVSLVFSTLRSDLEYLHRGTHTLAVRLPNSDWLRRLIRETGPLVAPSANHEGEPPAITISEAKAYFGDDVPLYIDDGPHNNQPSGLLDLTGLTPIIVRPLPSK